MNGKSNDGFPAGTSDADKGEFNATLIQRECRAAANRAARDGAISRRDIAAAVVRELTEAYDILDHEGEDES